MARRQRLSSSEARLTLFLDGRTFDLTEDSRQVDGIGGVAWDGSFLMALTLQRLVDSSPTASSLHVLELGCGLGVCGISIASRVAAVTLTDQSVDLATANSQSTHDAANVVAMPLSWGQGQEGGLLRRRDAGPPDIVVGCEVACLRSQQRKLVDTIRHLAVSRTVVLLSFDELPPPNRCSAERDMDALMVGAGFTGACISVARVSWSATEAGISTAKMEAVAFEAELCLGWDESACSSGSGLTPNSESEGMHHIVAYFKKEAAVICARCGRPTLDLFR